MNWRNVQLTYPVRFAVTALAPVIQDSIRWGLDVGEARLRVVGVTIVGIVLLLKTWKAEKLSIVSMVFVVVLKISKVSEAIV